MARTPYNEIPYIKPGVNGSFLLWLTLLGIPALLVFLVYSKHPAPPAIQTVEDAGTQYEQPSYIDPNGR